MRQRRPVSTTRSAGPCRRRWEFFVSAAQKSYRRLVGQRVRRSSHQGRARSIACVCGKASEVQRGGWRRWYTYRGGCVELGGAERRWLSSFARSDVRRARASSDRSGFGYRKLVATEEKTPPPCSKYSHSHSFILCCIFVCCDAPTPFGCDLEIFEGPLGAFYDPNYHGSRWCDRQYRNRHVCCVPCRKHSGNILRAIGGVRPRVLF
eukprot:Rmarinus@m.16809